MDPALTKGLRLGIRIQNAHGTAPSGTAAAWECQASPGVDPSTINRGSTCFTTLLGAVEQEIEVAPLVGLQYVVEVEALVAATSC